MTQQLTVIKSVEFAVVLTPTHLFENRLSVCQFSFGNGIKKNHRIYLNLNLPTERLNICVDYLTGNCVHCPKSVLEASRNRKINAIEFPVNIVSKWKLFHIRIRNPILHPLATPFLAVCNNTDRFFPFHIVNKFEILKVKVQTMKWIRRCPADV